MLRLWLALSAVIITLSLASFALALAIFHPEKLRSCVPPWRTAEAAQERPRIAVATMQDDRAYAVPDTLADVLGQPRGCPPMDVLSMTWPNKARYVARHGYALVNGSDLMDHSRPLSWSKLSVVQSVLKQNDWVFWLDADTYVTNDNVRIEAILPARDGPDIVLTGDSGGVNAGAWMVRNTDWSVAFLQRWWESTSYIRRTPGDSKSGDNDALKALIAQMPPAERQRHVGHAPQCSFNSYIWRTSVRTLLRLLRWPSKTLQGIWRPGDFVLHLAGFRNKGAALMSVSADLRPTADESLSRSSLSATAGESNE